MSQFDPVARRELMRAKNFWSDRLVNDVIAEAVQSSPQKLAIAAYRAGQSEPVRMTYAALWDAVARFAGSLRGLGIGQGDIVSIQLPNWWEFTVATFACWRVGAAVNPLMPIFRAHELRFMLKFAAVKLVIVPKIFRGFDHEAMLRDLRAELPDLLHVITVDGEGAESFAALLNGDPLPASVISPLRPDDTAVLIFTSGTTGAPKAVMHSANTLMACIEGLSERFALTAADAILVCSPVGHMTGFAACLMLGLTLGASVALQDVWDGPTAIRIMAAEGITFTAGSTPFLVDLCETVAGGMPRPARLRAFLCGGAPIPPVLIERALQKLDVSVCSLWGSTEALSGSLTEPARAAEKSSTTDGRAIRGVEISIVDEAGTPLQTGQTGRLLVRGAPLFLGYYKRPLADAFDAGGWFDTGDLACMDDEGYIRISGRTKDILIRGGENIPVFEIEDLLYRHPAIAGAAIVGYPDQRLGERACAFVVLRPGATLGFGELQAYLEASQVARQYWPERLEIVPDLPATATGKIKKFALRERLLREGDRP